MKFPNYKKLLSVITAVTLTAAPVLSPFPVMAQEEELFSAETAESEVPSVVSDISSELTDEIASTEPDESISEAENTSDDPISSEPEETAEDTANSEEPSSDNSSIEDDSAIEEEISVDEQDPDSSSDLELTEENDSAQDDSEEILMDENTQKNLEDLFDSNDANVTAAGNETNYTLGTTLTVDTEDTVSYYFVADKTGFYKIEKEVLNYTYDEDGDIDGSYGSSLSSAFFLRKGESYRFTLDSNTFTDFDDFSADVYYFTLSLYKDLSDVSGIVDAGIVLYADYIWILDNSQTLTVSGSETPSIFGNDEWEKQLEIIDQYKDSIKTISFTDGATAIDDSFSNLPKLQTINLPSTLTDIRESFNNCPSLKSVIFPKSLEYLDGFNDCSSLESVILQKPLSFLRGFNNWSSLKSVILPGSLNYLYDGFNNCKNIESISLPANSNLSFIDPNAFTGSTWYNSQKNFVILGDIALKYRGTATSTTVPDNVRLFKTFADNTTVKNVTIPKSVTSVSYASFAGATALEKVVLRQGVKSIDRDAFLSCKNLKEITIPKSVTDFYRSSIGYYCSGDKIYLKLPKSSLPTINCYSNSAAHKYAVENGIPYKLLDVLTVKFNGSGAKPSKASIKVTCKKTYGALPTVKRTGYTFLGWYTAPKGGSKITAKSLVTSTKNHTLYARWKGNKVTVKFNGNGAKPSKASLVKELGKTYGSLPSVRRNGYIFQGWYTAKTKGTKVTSKSYVKNHKTHTLYARWKKK